MKLMHFSPYAMWSTVCEYTPELYPAGIQAEFFGLASSVGSVGPFVDSCVVVTVPHSPGGRIGFTVAAAFFAIAAVTVPLLGRRPKAAG